MKLNVELVAKELGAPELVPARMLNEFIFCPRLFYLEWVQGEWADNRFTEEGRAAHTRSDQRAGDVPPPDVADMPDFKARAVDLSAPIVGLTGKIDVLEGKDGCVSPVDFKRGEPPKHLPERAYEPERVQLCAYALALRENGYRVDKGILFFVGAHRRVEVPIDEALVARTLSALRDLKACCAARVMPQPLHQSPKCPGCSLNGICLPDEFDFLEHGHSASTLGEVRLLYAPRDDALPVYVQEQGARIGISDEVLQIRSPSRDGKDGPVREVRLGETSQVSVFGNVGVTTPAIRQLCAADIPVGFFSYGAWFYGRLEGLSRKNIDLRRAQFRAAEDRDFCMRLASRLVAAKILNCRTMLRRNHPSPPRAVMDGLDASQRSARLATNMEMLLGIEGNAARLYFSAFEGMLKPPDYPSSHSSQLSFNFERRNRRPPKDPINALLSFSYALLTKDLTYAVLFAGFDPLLGFYHQPRYGRPGLALDLMEEFRPLIADSVVLQCVNTGAIKTDDFIQNHLGVALTPSARKKLIQTYERRMDQLITHPVFGYRVSYRRILAVQARLLGKYLLGEIKEFPEFVTR
ncbi:MAG: CRISPR-associated endonuclease Cas1 [Myxococcales bacterium]|nr:CRISPR-associated endonuclease Cas1 [Myxococcales bacterium]